MLAHLRCARMTVPLVGVVATCVLVAGCAGGPRATEKAPVPRTFDSIAIVSPAEFLDYVQLPPGGESRRTSRYTATESGAAAGIMAGSAVGALACGPFLYGLCWSGLALAGSLAGGIGGYVVDVSREHTDDGGELTRAEVAHKLEARLKRLDAHHDLQTDFVDALRASLPAAMLGPVEHAQVQALVSISQLGFAAEEEGLYLALKVRLQYATELDQAENPEGVREFSGRSAAYPQQFWIDATAEQVRAAELEGRDQLVDEVAGFLRGYWSGGASGA